ncbi:MULTISPECIES: hypothetical protein [unclassified Caballeronia]|uniref:hypothetical protein n=1 Tax=unclassified Caballeronia TaxID=2646786 RepID=UPI001F1B5F6D|nr:MULTISPECIES: hypothetical protein [unclassified Caballeronia]MCE4543938.1 hypothetical protein [Caballeronia sp. PC1]MCE4571090.1 hypothetical protein [Caballeronia sp. CLC5]
MSSTIADVRRLPAGRLFNPRHRSFTTTVIANSGSPPDQKAKSTHLGHMILKIVNDRLRAIPVV